MTKRLLICFALLALLLTFLSNANSMDTSAKNLNGIKIALYELDMRISAMENRASLKAKSMDLVERQLNDLRLQTARLTGVDSAAYQEFNSEIDQYFARLTALNKALRAQK